MDPPQNAADTLSLFWSLICPLLTIYHRISVCTNISKRLPAMGTNWFRDDSMDLTNNDLLRLASHPKQLMCFSFVKKLFWHTECLDQATRDSVMTQPLLCFALGAFKNLARLDILYDESGEDGEENELVETVLSYWLVHPEPFTTTLQTCYIGVEQHGIMPAVNLFHRMSALTNLTLMYRSEYRQLETNDLFSLLCHPSLTLLNLEAMDFDVLSEDVTSLDSSKLSKNLTTLHLCCDLTSTLIEVFAWALRFIPIENLFCEWEYGFTPHRCYENLHHSLISLDLGTTEGYFELPDLDLSVLICDVKKFSHVRHLACGLFDCQIPSTNGDPLLLNALSQFGKILTLYAPQLLSLELTLPNSQTVLDALAGCHRLQKLLISGAEDTSFDMVPCWPNLRTLSIKWITFSEERVLTMLSGAPALEYLDLVVRGVSWKCLRGLSACPQIRWVDFFASGDQPIVLSHSYNLNPLPLPNLKNLAIFSDNHVWEDRDVRLLTSWFSRSPITTFHANNDSWSIQHIQLLETWEHLKSFPGWNSAKTAKIPQSLSYITRPRSSFDRNSDEAVQQFRHMNGRELHLGMLLSNYSFRSPEHKKEFFGGLHPP